MPKLLVLDTSALTAGFVPELSDAEQVTVPEVIEEAKSLSVKLVLETALISGKVKVMAPSKSAAKEVEKMLKVTGDSVSKTDTQLLALAVDLKKNGAEIVTDDYAIQNVARKLGIAHRPIKMAGIKKVFEWEMACPACGRKYPVTIQKCTVCGSGLKKQPKK
ncbi:MAG: ribonuclease VapC [Candidatus Hadarchaeota archaeon]